MTTVPNIPNVMLDLETMGTRPGSVIVSLGAVEFDPQSARLGRTFYQTCSIASAVDVGLAMDPETVTWWLAQNDEARKELTNAKGDLKSVLTAFSHWLFHCGKNVKIWGNGSDFDNALLAEAYRRVDMTIPWQFWNNRCYRTMKSLYKGVKLEREGTHHNALDDAIYQAKHLQMINREIMRCPAAA